MAEEELLPPPYFVGRMLGILPTPCLRLRGRGWIFIPQDGVRRPGVKMYLLMEPPSGGSISIEVIFWGTGSPREITFFLMEPVRVPMNLWGGNNPWRFVEEIWRLYAALRC